MVEILDKKYIHSERNLPLTRPANALALLEASLIILITPSRLSSPITMPYKNSGCIRSQNGGQYFKYPHLPPPPQNKLQKAVAIVNCIKTCLPPQYAVYLVLGKA